MSNEDLDYPCRLKPVWDLIPFDFYDVDAALERFGRSIDEMNLAQVDGAFPAIDCGDSGD